MKVTERFQIGRPLGLQRRKLRADTYNQAQLLLARSGEDAVFVPIRPMQYLAVIEPREFIFVDGLGGRTVDLIWRDFQPGNRTSLDDPVPFELAYFRPSPDELIRRLHVEFARALALLAERRNHSGAGHVVSFKKPS